MLEGREPARRTRGTGMRDIGLRSWREVLGELCQDPLKKKEVAEAVGFVSLRTVERWMNGQSNPQKEEYIRKLSFLNDDLAEALQREFPEAFHASPSHFSSGQTALPVEFYRRVVRAFAHVPLPSRRWTIFHLVSQMMIPHLDPESAGLVAITVRSGDQPRQLVFGEGGGNTVWKTRQVTQQTVEDGDSPLLQALAHYHPLFIQSCASSNIFPPACLVQAGRIQGLGFFPLYRAGVAAGGLLLCSTQEDFFTPLRQALVEEYTSLLSLAFLDRDFFP